MNSIHKYKVFVDTSQIMRSITTTLPTTSRKNNNSFFVKYHLLSSKETFFFFFANRWEKTEHPEHPPIPWSPSCEATVLTTDLLNMQMKIKELSDKGSLK